MENLRFRGLGFSVPGVPLTSDPVNGYVDIALTEFGKALNKTKPDLVRDFQDPLAAALDKISIESQNPAATAAQLFQWANEVHRLGQAFYNEAIKFSKTGPGGIRTILGVQTGGKWTPAPPNAPGYLTVLELDILRKAQEAEMRGTGLGFDWNTLITGGIDTIEDILDGPDVPGYQTPPMFPPGYYPSAAGNYGTAAAAVPSWVWIGLAVGALFYLSQGRR